MKIETRNDRARRNKMSVSRPNRWVVQLSNAEHQSYSSGAVKENMTNAEFARLLMQFGWEIYKDEIENKE